MRLILKTEAPLPPRSQQMQINLKLILKAQPLPVVVPVQTLNPVRAREQLPRLPAQVVLTPQAAQAHRLLPQALAPQ